MSLLLSLVGVLYVQSTIREEVSRNHEGMPPFWSGNFVGASPYAAAYFRYISKRRDDPYD
jgi:hypothetical protein